MAALSIIAMLLLGFAWLLVGSDGRSHHELEERFEDRGELAARFLHTYIADLAAVEQARAQQLLSRDAPSRDEFERVAEFRFQAAVLLDNGGRLLHAWPRKTSLIGTNIAPKYQHLQAAVTTGRVSVSGVVLSAVERIPIVAIAIPFDTPHGRRVFSGAFDLQRSPLGAYLANSVFISGSGTYVVDAQGHPVIASDPEVLRNPDAAQRRLFTSALTLPLGGHRRGADFVAVERIAGTPWRLVMTVPAANLFAPVDGFSNDIGWVLLALFALTCAAALVLLQRLRRTNAGLAATGIVRERLLYQERIQTDRLRELDHMKDEFVALASHELRTPLTSIGGYLELLLDDADRLAPDQLAFLHTVSRNSDRVLRLVNDLLDLSRIENHEMSLELVELSLSPIAHEALHEHTPSAAAKSITLRSTIPQVVMVVGDPTRLRQVIDNLLSNAIKYTSPGGEVHFTLAASGDGSTIVVSDDGPGIPDHEQAYVFEPFYRAASARDQHIQGTGLGLAISRAIVLAHGGEIFVQSLTPGGTAFSVWLPRTAPPLVKERGAAPRFAPPAEPVPA